MELNGRPATTGELASLALHGYGHFTTMLVTDLRVRGLDLHMDRLSRDCRTLFGTELDIPRVRELARRSARARPSPAVIRVTVFDPGLDLGRPAGRSLPQILITTRPAPSPDRLPPPLRLGVRRYTRDTPGVKGTGLFGAIHQRRAAQLEGHDDALFSGVDGRVSEGPTWNICFLEGGGLVWPQAPALDGVTARLVSGLAEDMGLAVSTRPLSAAAAARTAGAFVTNAVTGVRPVTAIDGARLPLSSLTNKLAATYRDLPGDPL